MTSASSDAVAPPRAPLAPLRAWWRGRAARERLMLAAAGAVVALTLLWMAAIRPALATLRQAPSQIAALEQQLQAMQRLAAEARELRATPPLPPDQAGAALKAASERLGDKARLALQGDRAVLTLTGLDGESLRGWLAEVRSGARARPLDAQLARGPQGLTGTITVSIGGAP